MNHKTFMHVATVVFSIGGVVHLYRAAYGLPFNLAGWEVPVLLSWIAGLFALFMAYTGYKHIR
ncbi:MAG: hypothetical protein Q7S26_02745 [bacterium]|nr:hypothetical protein [bacterium]